MKSKTILTRFFTIVSVLLLVLPFKTSAQGIKKEAQLGNIAVSSGEVLVRSKGRWGRLTSATQPIFSTDKVVTRQGRAEIRLTSGGIIRLDIDSNLSFVKKREVTGIVDKRLIITSQVNILVGKAWFEINPEIDHFVILRTPSFSTKISSASGEINVGIDGDTKCGLVSGDMITSGNYTKIPNPEPMTRGHVTTGKLPASDPKIDNTPLQKAAVKNVLSYEAADAAASHAGQLLDAARKAGEQAARSKTETARKEAAEKIAEALVDQSNASIKESMAYLATTEEALHEAELFGDTDTVTTVKGALEQIAQALNKTETFTREATKTASEVKTTAGADYALAKAAVVETKAGVSAANTNIIKTISMMALTNVSGDERITVSAQKVLTQLQETASRIEGVSSQVEKDAAGIKDMEGDRVKAMALAVQIMADVVSAHASNADALAEIALNAVAKDPVSLEKAEAAAIRVEQIVKTTEIASENARDNATAGNLDKVEEIARIVDDASREAEVAEDEPEPVLVTEPVEQAPLLPTEEALPSLPDSEDLLTASPSA